MRSLVSTLGCLALWVFIVQAQNPDWLWAKSGSGSDVDHGVGMASDKEGNIYITGYFRSPVITFGTNVLSRVGDYDIFIVKYDSEGNVLWARSAGGEGTDISSGITVDAFGDIYVTGYFRNASITFNSITLSNKGQNDIFVAKYDSDGNIIWAKSAGGTGYDYCYGLVTDAEGNVYITGQFSSNSMEVDTLTLNLVNFTDIFVIKYDRAGNMLWAKSYGDTGAQVANSIAVGEDGEVYLSGFFDGTSFALDTITLFNKGSRDAFIIKLNGNGNPLWAKSAGNSGDDRGGYIVTDNGNILVTGVFTSSSVNFDSTYLYNNNSGLFNTFLVKYDKSGNVIWAKHENEFFRKITPDGTGNFYIAGQLVSQYYVFGTDTFHNAGGGGDVFLVKYDKEGNILWVNTAGGTGRDFGSQVAVNRQGNVFVTGSFDSPSVKFGSTTLTRAGSYDVFNAGFPCTSLPRQPDEISGDTIVCPGASLSYSVLPVPGAGSYIWNIPPGWSGSSDSNSITVLVVGRDSGMITVTAVNACGKSAVQSFKVSVVPLPEPEITQSANLLYAQPGLGTYHWYRNDSLISGAEDNEYTFTESGDYYVIVTSPEGCTGKSNTITINISGIFPSGNQELHIYPNPNKGVFRIEGLKTGSTHYEVIDATGKTVAEGQVSNGNEIRASGLPAGFYLLRLVRQNSLMQLRFIVKD